MKLKHDGSPLTCPPLAADTGAVLITVPAQIIILLFSSLWCLLFFISLILYGTCIIILITGIPCVRARLVGWWFSFGEVGTNSNEFLISQLKTASQYYNTSTRQRKSTMTLLCAESKNRRHTCRGKP